jgi:hypothetical protein
MSASLSIFLPLHPGPLLSKATFFFSLCTHTQHMQNRSPCRMLCGVGVLQPGNVSALI